MDAKRNGIVYGFLVTLLWGSTGTVIGAERDSQESTDPASKEITAAFDIQTVTIHELLPLPEDAHGHVRQASASRPVEDPRVLKQLKRAEKLASEVRTIGDLGDLIEQVGAKPTNRQLAKVAGWAFNRRGELHAEAGDERAAFDDFQQAIVADDRCWQALHNRGVTLARYGRSEAALEDFTRALRLNPTFTVCYANRAALYLSLGQAAAAEADYSRVLADETADESNDVGIYAGRAAARADLGRTSEAVRDLNQALRLDPQSAELRAQRGALFAAERLHEQAVTDFGAAMKLDPHCAAAYQGIAWLLATCDDARFRDPTKAVAAADRAIQFGQPNDPLLLATAAAAHATAGDRDQAVRYQQQALLLAPESDKPEYRERLALYRRGFAYREAK